MSEISQPDIVSSLRTPSDCIVTVPKFKFEYEMDVLDTLQKMGVTSPFGSETAKLKRMFKQPDGEYVSHFSHKATIEVNKEGAKAAATTGIGFMSRSMAFHIDLNKPFRFFIHDKKFATPLFVGQVTCPSGQCEPTVASPK